MLVLWSDTEASECVFVCVCVSVTVRLLIPSGSGGGARVKRCGGEVSGD